VKALVVRAGALGDLVLLRRAIHALRAAGYAVDLLAPPAGRVLVGAGEVDHLLPWDAPETARFLAAEETDGLLGQALRAADVVIAFSRAQSVTSALRARAGRLVLHDPAPPPAGPHASEWLARALVSLGVVDAGPPPDLAFTDEERTAGEAIAAPLPPGFLAVHPGSGSVTKNWPADRYAALAQRLSPDRPWLLVQGPAEPAFPVTPGAVVARDLPLRVLGALLARASLFVGNDSGVSHLAAAAGAPTLALFGPTDPALWSPVGRAVRCLRAGVTGPPAFRVDEVAEVVTAHPLR
jgi:heptosyltransferase-3